MSGLPTYPDCPIPREPPSVTLDKGKTQGIFVVQAGLPRKTTFFLHIRRECVALRVELLHKIAENVGKEYNVLPLFEKFLFEYKYRKYYSLQRNKFLQCRWRSYVEHYEDREFAPFNFVDIRDFHFYNGMIRLLPEESIHRVIEFPYKLGVGPGVDFRGQMPIPQDMMMKRGLSKPKAKGKIYLKTTNESQNEIIDK